ncbi:MAG TPA: hypothetical protein VJ912_02820 [Candidatus Nanoarchaeia archaeon]|nr:hypothetical protein [Candidatus Nanoarchaeia archaeon]
MPRKNIRDILGLEKGESLIREDFNEREFEKRMKKVAEYQKICQERKKVDWNKLSKIHFLPANLWVHRFYDQKRSQNYSERVRGFLESARESFNNIRDYFSGK